MGFMGKLTHDCGMVLHFQGHTGPIKYCTKCGEELDEPRQVGFR